MTDDHTMHLRYQPGEEIIIVYCSCGHESGPLLTVRDAIDAQTNHQFETLFPGRAR